MLEAAFYVGSAFWLGALHAATPGHGKTVAAAYLVGNRGRVVDAVTLGIIVTLSHTGGIVLFGVLATMGSSALLPRQAEGWLALGTGLLIVVLGLWMFWGQRRTLPWSPRSDAAPSLEPTPAPDHAHAHGHPHAHEFPQAHGHPHRGHAPDVAQAHAHSHQYERERSRESILVGHGNDATLHRHGWGAAHSHDAGLDDAARPSFALLLGLGIAGGVMPDPAALAVLLSALASGKLVLGLITVLVFSLGFASVLVVVGLVAARVGTMVLDRIGGGTWTRWVQLATSIIVVGVGAVMTASAWRTLATLA